jgi:xanthosine utilization system XapX-like protein
MKKKLLALGAGMAATVATTVTAFASGGGGFDVGAAIGTGVTEIQTTAMGAIGAVAPVAIAIVGAILGVKIGIRAFRSLVG